jgi:hypothetical protein
VTTLPAACLALLVFGASGAAPVLCVVGIRWQALFLAPLAGAIIAAVAGACVVAIAGSAVTWFVGLSTIGLGAGAAVLWSKRRGDLPRAHRSGSGGLRAPRAVGLAVVVGAVAWSLQQLRVPSVGFDARAFWLLRASWFVAGHQMALAAFRNPLLLADHASYPPLVSAAVAVAWQITGNHSYRLGVVITSLLNGCAIAGAAWVLIESGDLATNRLRHRSIEVHQRDGANADRPALLWTPLIVSRVVAGLFVLVVFGVIGPFATNGYADPLWSVAAAGAIGYGLLLPRTPANIGAAGVLLGVAGLTKAEGTATAIGIVALIVARSVWARWKVRGQVVGRGGRSLSSRRSIAIPILVGLAGTVVLASWTVLMRLIGAAKDVNTSGRRQGTMITRLHLTFNAMSPHLHVLLLAVPISVAGGLFLRVERQESGMERDLWAWAGLCSGLLIVAGAYISGPGNAPLWLVTSVHRTTMFPAIVAWLLIAEWTVISTCWQRRRRRAMEDDAARPVRPQLEPAVQTQSASAPPGI